MPRSHFMDERILQNNPTAKFLYLEDGFYELTKAGTIRKRSWYHENPVKPVWECAFCGRFGSERYVKHHFIYHYRMMDRKADQEGHLERLIAQNGNDCYQPICWSCWNKVRALFRTWDKWEEVALEARRMRRTITSKAFRESIINKGNTERSNAMPKLGFADRKVTTAPRNAQEMMKLLSELMAACINNEVELENAKMALNAATRIVEVWQADTRMKVAALATQRVLTNSGTWDTIEMEPTSQNANVARLAP